MNLYNLKNLNYLLRTVKRDGTASELCESAETDRIAVSVLAFVLLIHMNDVRLLRYILP